MLVFKNAVLQFAGHTGVERLGAVAHDVNVIDYRAGIHRSFDCLPLAWQAGRPPSG